jgi:hypothetical protein
MDAGATCVTGGVEGAAWGASEVVDTARGAAEVSKAGDEGAAQGLAVSLPGLTVGPPASVRGRSECLGSWSDR